MGIKEQESTPDFFDEMTEKPEEQEVIRRQVHRAFDGKVNMVEKEKPSDDEFASSDDGEIRKVTIRKRVIRRVIVLSDGTRKEVEEEVEDSMPVVENIKREEYDIPAPVLIKEQESTPDFFVEMTEKPEEHEVIRRQVHRASDVKKQVIDRNQSVEEDVTKSDVEKS